jgi:hypothetical protein
MDWIVKAAIVNTIWVLWCTQRVPARLVTKFGPNNRAAGTMSRAGFAVFFLVLPLVTAAFMAFIGGVAGQSAIGLAAAMDHFAAGMIIFFSLLAWCIARSNRNSPARLDGASFVVSMIVLMAFTFIFIRDIPKDSGKQNQTSIASERYQGSDSLKARSQEPQSPIPAH